MTAGSHDPTAACISKPSIGLQLLNRKNFDYTCGSVPVMKVAHTRARQSYISVAETGLHPIF